MATATIKINVHKTAMAIANPPKTIPPMASPFDGPAVSGAARFFNFVRLNTPVTTAATPSTPPSRKIPQHGTSESRNPAPPLEIETREFLLVRLDSADWIKWTTGYSFGVISIWNRSSNGKRLLNGLFYCNLFHNHLPPPADTGKELRMKPIYRESSSNTVLSARKNTIYL